MTLARLPVAICMLLTPLATARASETATLRKVGEETEIIRTYTFSVQSEGGSSSSSGSDAVLERVVEIRGDSVVLEYDLPRNASDRDRARTWQFPARVLKSSSGPTRLLNVQDIESRIARWIEAAGTTRAACGRWIFTWTALKVECDPQSVVDTVDGYDLRSPKIGDGELYRDAEARTAGVLKRTDVGALGVTYTTLLPVDPDVVRRSRAQADVVGARITGRALTLDDALRRRANENVVGTISIVIETDTDGNVWRRTKLAKLMIADADGTSETSTRTEIVTGRPASTPRP